MTREEAVGEATFAGFAGIVLLSAGSLVASWILSTLDPWVGAFPAILVWGVFVYYGTKQFAHGIYTIVEDAVGR